MPELTLSSPYFRVHLKVSPHNTINIWLRRSLLIFIKNAEALLKYRIWTVHCTDVSYRAETYRNYINYYKSTHGINSTGIQIYHCLLYLLELKLSHVLTYVAFKSIGIKSIANSNLSSQC